MKKKFFLILFLVALFASFLWFFNFKQKSKSIHSHYPSLENIGAITYENLKNELGDKNIIVLGSFPAIYNYQLVWEGFLFTAKKDNLNFDVLLEHSDLKPLRDYLFRKDIIIETKSWQDDELLESIKKYTSENKKVLVHNLNYKTSSLTPQSLRTNLAQLYKNQVLSITQNHLVVSQEELPWIVPSCKSTFAGYQLSCQAEEYSTSHFSSDLDNSKYISSSTSPFAEEFILHIRSPRQQQ